MTKTLPTILINTSTERGIRLKGDIIGDINILIRETGQKFRGHYHIIVTRDNLQVLFLEVEYKLRFSFTNDDTEVIGCVVLLVTSHQFDHTCFTNDRYIRKLIDGRCLLEFLQLLRSQDKLYILRSCLLYTSDAADE